MSEEGLHYEDHRKMINMLDASQKVSEVNMRVVLLEERIKELKEDKEKNSVLMRWIGGMAFTIIMVVAGSAINQKSTVQVLQEKVMEQKTEIGKLSEYINGVDNDLQYQIDQIE